MHDGGVLQVTLNRPDVGNAINDQVLAVIPGKLKTGAGASTIDKDNQGDLRRFFVGPNHAEVTGFGFTPDNTTLFINIQHPSNWPAYNTEDATRATVGTVRPRASTVAIRRKDGGKIGPEFTFGIYMEKELKEPILIIKTAWGGRSLNTEFRPPSAGQYKLPKEIQELWDKHPQGAHGVPKLEDRKKWQAAFKRIRHK